MTETDSLPPLSSLSTKSHNQRLNYLQRNQSSNGVKEILANTPIYNPYSPYSIVHSNS